MRPMTIEDFLKYVNAEAHYASGIFCFCEYSVDFNQITKMERKEYD